MKNNKNRVAAARAHARSRRLRTSWVSLCALIVGLLLLGLTSCSGSLGGFGSGSGAGSGVGSGSDGAGVADVADVNSALDGSPTAVVSSTLDVFKLQDPAVLASNPGGDDSYLDEAINAVHAKVLEFDYDIVGEQIHGSSATVSVNITTYQFGKAYVAARSGLSDELAKLIADKNITDLNDLAFSEDNINVIFTTKFGEQLASAAKDYRQGIEFTLSQNAEGYWAMNSITSQGEIINALYGNMINAAAEMPPLILNSN